MAVLIAAGVPVSRVFTLAGTFVDPHFAAREMLLNVPHPVLGSMQQVGIVPNLSETPGQVQWSGREIGQDSRRILADVLGLAEVTIQDLVARGIVRAAD